MTKNRLLNPSRETVDFSIANMFSVVVIHPHGAVKQGGGENGCKFSMWGAHKVAMGYPSATHEIPMGSS